MAKWTKRILGAGVVAGAAYALWKVIDQRTRESSIEWTPQPLLSPPRPVPHVPESMACVEPVGGACPASHPVKAKLGSGIFHVPGGQMYDRTAPERCYVDAAAAEADGLRASKR